MKSSKFLAVAATMAAMYASIAPATAQTSNQQRPQNANLQGLDPNKAHAVDEMLKRGLKAVVEKVTYASQFATKEKTFNVFVASQDAPEYSEEFQVTSMDGTPLDETRNGIVSGADYLIVQTVEVKSGSVEYNYNSTVKIGEFVQMTVAVNGAERSIRPNISGQSINGVFPLKSGEKAVFKIRVTTKGAKLPDFPEKK
jgi:hypothetical protein